MMKKMRVAAYFCIMIVFIVLDARSVFADNLQKGIQISPSLYELSLNQNEDEKSFVMTVTNTTDKSVVLRLLPIEFKSLDESGGVMFLGKDNDFTKTYNAASWIRLSHDALVVNPNDTQNVIVTIENRENLSPGGNYGAVVFQIENDRTEDIDESRNVTVNQLFSSLIFVKKTGGEVYDMGMNVSNIQKGLWFPVEKFAIRFQNKGNVHIVPRGVITITDPLGRVVQKSIVNQDSALVMPDSFRSLTITPKAVSHFFVPGYYTITVQYRYDDQENFDTYSESVFFAMPIVIVCFVVVSIIFVFIKRRRLKE